MTNEEADKALNVILSNPNTNVLYEDFLGKLEGVRSFMASWAHEGLSRDETLLLGSHFFLCLAVQGMKQAGAAPYSIHDVVRTLVEGTP